MRQVLLLLFLLFSSLLFSQNSRLEIQSKHNFPIKSAEQVKVDGILNEPVWQTASVLDSFWQKWPIHGNPAQHATKVQVTHDDKFLYVAARLYGSTDYVIQSLKRDVGYWDSDGFAVVLDPNNQAGNGYFFGTNAAGVQIEGLISPPGDDGFDSNWDNVWFTEVSKQSDHLAIEIAIPLRILRYNEGQTDWAINFIRNDISINEYSTWIQMPLQLNATNLGYMGRMDWEIPPAATKGNVNLVPYISSGLNRDYEEGEPWSFIPNVGLDAKIGIGSSLNLDVTINPDFSQIEVDEQVVNLTRFSIFLPEKRTFFLENADVFGRYGIPPMRPFFSRRIGLDEDGNAVPILYGLRLTGNLNSKTRIGVMNMQTGSTDADPARNFSALTGQYNLFGRTTVAGYLLNRQDFEGSDFAKNGFSRNAGLEWFYLNNEGTFGWWTNYHHSFKPNISDKNGWGNAGFFIAEKNLEMLVDIVRANENYFPDMGYETRISNYDALLDTTFRFGYNQIFVNGSYRFIPENEDSKLNFSSLGWDHIQFYNMENKPYEIGTTLSYRFSFRNTTSIRVEARHQWEDLPVHIKFDDGDNDVCAPLPKGIYEYSSGNISYGSDYRKKFTYVLTAGGGQFYNGTIQTASASMGYRLQPFANFNLSMQYNNILFPEPHCDVEIFNITPRVEVFFNREINWTTFVQYNTQADNFNVNSRLQWRFRPMSDLFVVFTDNRYGNTGQIRNRGLVAKLNYWW